MPLPRTHLSADEFRTLLRDQFFPDRKAADFNSQVDRLREMHQLLNELMYQRIIASGRNTQDDVYLVYDFFRNRLVYTEFVGGHLEFLEQIAAECLQDPRFEEHGVMVNPGDDTAIIPGGVSEVVTRSRIFVKRPD